MERSLIYPCIFYVVKYGNKNTDTVKITPYCLSGYPVGVVFRAIKRKEHKPLFLFALRYSSDNNGNLHYSIHIPYLIKYLLGFASTYLKIVPEPVSPHQVTWITVLAGC